MGYNMKDKTNRLHIIIYVLLVIALSVLLLMLHSVFKNVGDYSVSFPQFAPALALIILLAGKRT
jgi:hypothetical protein